MGNNSVPKFIFRLSRFPVYRGNVLGRFYCVFIIYERVDHIAVYIVTYRGYICTTVLNFI